MCNRKTICSVFEDFLCECGAPRVAVSSERGSDKTSKRPPTREPFLLLGLVRGLGPNLLLLFF